ncbi:MAG: hypothetical protein ABFS28_16865, partial [Bacteroidota bacterium]
MALIVLIAVQYIFITETYRTKKEQFDAKFGVLVREGMQKFNSLDFRFDFDSVLFTLDNLAVEYQYASNNSLVYSPGQAFYKILNEYRQPEAFISDYIHKAGMDP